MMRKNKIKFKENYRKLAGQTKGVLIKVDEILRRDTSVYAISKAFQVNADDTPPLKGTHFLVLTFQGEHYHPFIEIRKFTQKSYNSYSAKVGEEYEFVIEEKKDAND